MPETTKLALLWWVGSHAVSWCAGLLGRQPADKDHVPPLATGTNRRFVGLRMLIGPIVTYRGLGRRGGSVELEQKTNPGGLLALGGVP